MTEIALVRPRNGPVTEQDLRDRIAYGGGHRELVDGCLLLSRDSGPFTYADLWDLPDDGRKHELLDGQILVSPAPNRTHQRVVTRLARRIGNVLPDGIEALVAPYDVHLLGGLPTTLQPDLVILPVTDTEPTEGDVEHALCVVEVLSPSTRRFDLDRKRRAYARGGVPLYLIVDPGLTAPHVPWLAVLELHGRRYREVARVAGDHVAHLPSPLSLDVTPNSLVQPRPGRPAP